MGEQEECEKEDWQLCQIHAQIPGQPEADPICSDLRQLQRWLRFEYTHWGWSLPEGREKPFP